MATRIVIAIALILYGLVTLYVALAQPPAIWRTSKLQGFEQLLGKQGTVILLLLVAIATLLGGVLLLRG